MLSVTRTSPHQLIILHDKLAGLQSLYFSSKSLQWLPTAATTPFGSMDVLPSLQDRAVLAAWAGKLRSTLLDEVPR